MSSTWELGLEKLTVTNLENLYDVMGGRRPTGKIAKKEMLKKVYAKLDDAFIEASDTIDTVKAAEAGEQFVRPLALRCDLFAIAIAS